MQETTILQRMISVHDAVQLIRSNASLLPLKRISLQNACGLVLAEDVYAQVDVPPFHQSAMDGYAICYADFLQSKEFTVVGEVAAGDKNHFTLQPHQAIRIFTGAPVSDGLDAVVMQEKTEIVDNKIIVKDEQLLEGSNIRIAGSEIEKGRMALPNGTVLTPAAIGFLAGIGVSDVSIHPKPIVHIIVTGKELQKPGNTLQYGQVYESNSVMLQTALEQLHIQNTEAIATGDDETEISSALSAALEKADLVLLTGGVSVGDYDYVVKAAAHCGVQQLFHKVAQRPGKPLYAGKKNQKLVFGLPGNPASVLSCFYTYVVVAIEELTGRRDLLERKHLPLLASFSKKIPLRQFLKAIHSNEGVMPLTAQESFRLSSFAVANCLIILPEEVRDYHKGETVEVLLLPYL